MRSNWFGAGPPSRWVVARVVVSGLVGVCVLVIGVAVAAWWSKGETSNSRPEAEEIAPAQIVKQQQSKAEIPRLLPARMTQVVKKAEAAPKEAVVPEKTPVVLTEAAPCQQHEQHQQSEEGEEYEQLWLTLADAGRRAIGAVEEVLSLAQHRFNALVRNGRETIGVAARAAARKSSKPAASAGKRKQPVETLLTPRHEESETVAVRTPAAPAKVRTRVVPVDLTLVVRLRQDAKGDKEKIKKEVAKLDALPDEDLRKLVANVVDAKKVNPEVLKRFASRLNFKTLKYDTKKKVVTCELLKPDLRPTDDDKKDLRVVCREALIQDGYVSPEAFNEWWPMLTITVLNARGGEPIPAPKDDKTPAHPGHPIHPMHPGYPIHPIHPVHPGVIHEPFHDHAFSAPAIAGYDHGHVIPHARPIYLAPIRHWPIVSQPSFHAISTPAVLHHHEPIYAPVVAHHQPLYHAVAAPAPVVYSAPLLVSAPAVQCYTPQVSYSAPAAPVASYTHCAPSTHSSYYSHCAPSTHTSCYSHCAPSYRSGHCGSRRSCGRRCR